MIQVIGAGLGRTGTKSLQEALIHLGYNNCYHMGELFLNPHGIKYWKEIHKKTKTDWHTLFEGYQAIVDFPGAYFYKQLSDQYPDAKVILTERDPEEWYASVRRTIYTFEPNFRSKLRLLMNAPFSSTARNIIKIAQFNKIFIWKEMFEGKFEDKEFAISKFLAHNEEVKRAIHADQLLVYRVSEGWDPLCRFLNLDTPRIQFPRSNSGQSFQTWAQGLITRSLSSN